MKERPILMSAPMVLATLADRKGQTRREMNPQPPEGWGGDSERAAMALSCRYGQPGDRLWVRENFSTDFAQHYPCDPVWYQADNDRKKEIERRDGVRGIWSPESKLFVPFNWRPSIFMPRHLSRITLEINGIRVERLQDISDEDAIAEGIERYEPIEDRHKSQTWWKWYGHTILATVDPVASYRSLWEKINGPGSWDANPWVWVIKFNRVLEAARQA